EALRAELGDPVAVHAGLGGARIVYHLGAAMRGGAAEHERSTVEGTRHVVEACLAHDVPLVYVSSLVVLDVDALGGDAPLTEDAPLEPHPEARGRYTQAKLRAERLVVDAVRERGLRAVIVRPGQLVAPGIPTATLCNAFDVAGRLVVLGDG